MTTKAEQASINKYDLLFESRITRSEATYESLLRSEKRIENWFIILFTMMIVGFVSLAGLIAKVAHWI